MAGKKSSKSPHHLPFIFDSQASEGVHHFGLPFLKLLPPCEVLPTPQGVAKLQGQYGGQGLETQLQILLHSLGGERSTKV